MLYIYVIAQQGAVKFVTEVLKFYYYSGMICFIEGIISTEDTLSDKEFEANNRYPVNLPTDQLADANSPTYKIE